MHTTPDKNPSPETISVIRMTVSFLNTKGLNIEGIALAGSRARGNEHGASDFDLLVVSSSSRSIHIEDVLLEGYKVQLFILPLKGIETFLILNTIAGNGILASMFDGCTVLEGSGVFERIKSNLRSNLRTMEQIERNSVNRNLNRLRNRISKLLKDLGHSNNADEDLYTGAELFKTAGQFLLAKRSRFFLPSEKHLHKELTKFYPARSVKHLGEVYRTSVANADYSSLITYCREVVLDGKPLHVNSSSISSLGSEANILCSVVFINSFDRRLIHLLYGILKGDHPQVVLNQDRDLLHPGVYFIVKIRDFHAFLNAFKALPLSRMESDSVTLNYQLDYFLLDYFKRYDHNGLLVSLSTYVMDNGMDRNIIMNSVLDWMLNSGISIFGKDQFTEYVRTCHRMYLPSMPHEPETFDLNRVADRNSRLEKELENLDLSLIIGRYREAVGRWICRDLVDEGIRKRIVEAYRTRSSVLQLHSVFENNSAQSSNFYHLFESVFNSTLLPHRERGLIYHSVMRVLDT